MLVIKSPMAAQMLRDHDIPSEYRPFLDHVREQMGGVDALTALERLAYNRPSKLGRPSPGDAVVLGYDLSVNAPMGSIGVIQGEVGRNLEKACIAFNAKNFRGPVYPDVPHNFDQWVVTSQGGGPITDMTLMDDLLPVEETSLVEFWMFAGDRDDLCNLHIYEINVPLWVWMAPRNL